MELQDEFTILKSFIAITKGGLTPFQLQKEYRGETGSPLNYKKYGFKDLLSMLRACPEIRVYQTPNGPMCEVVDEKMSHITSLVNRTKKRSKKNNNFNRQRRPSFCTTARSSPQRDSKYKSSVAPSSYKQGNTSRNYQDTYRPNYQRQYTQRNYVQYQEKGRSNPQSIAQSTTNSLFSGSKPVKDNQSLNTHVLPKGQSLNKQDPRPNSYQLVSSSSSTKSQSSCNSDPSIGEKSIQVTSQIYNSKPSVSRKNISSDSDWSSDSDTNQEPARVVVSSIKQLHSSKSVQNSTVSSSSRSKAPKKKKYFYERSACSFGARDVRYLSDTNKSNVHSQNLEKAPTPQERHPLIPLIQQQPSSSSFHAKTSAVFPQSASNVVRGSIGSKPKSAVQDGKPYFKTVTHAEKQSCIQTTPDSDKAITVGASPSKRMASATVRNGVPTIVVKVPNRNMVPSEIVERTVLNTCEPMYQGYQFIGDFLLTRVAEVCLTSTIQREGTISYCGLCRDDMTISECEEAIVREGTSGKVVLMIGMTDIMQGSSLEEMKRSTTSLLQRLKYNTVILITLPVPPSFVRVGNEEKLMVLELYNRWLLNLNLPCLIDIDRHLYSDAPFFMRQSYLEGETLSEEGAWVVMDEIVFALR